MGTPIINQPQVAILAVGAIKKRPVVVETPHGDSIAIRHMMYLSMSYDHRIVDGSLGATFLTAVALDLRDYLQGKNIKGIYSTNFNRTRATAQPTSQHFNLPINIYSPAQTNAMIDSLKAVNKNNILIVGHSNTVDDMVNRFTGTTTMTDLPETEYRSLFIVRKKGSNYTFEKITVPQTTPR